MTVMTMGIYVACRR